MHSSRQNNHRRTGAPISEPRVAERQRTWSTIRIVFSLRDDAFQIVFAGNPEQALAFALNMAAIENVVIVHWKN